MRSFISGACVISYSKNWFRLEGIAWSWPPWVDSSHSSEFSSLYSALYRLCSSISFIFVSSFRNWLLVCSHSKQKIVLNLNGMNGLMSLCTSFPSDQWMLFGVRGVLHRHSRVTDPLVHLLWFVRLYFVWDPVCPAQCYWGSGGTSWGKWATSASRLHALLTM